MTLKGDLLKQIDALSPKDKLQLQKRLSASLNIGAVVAPTAEADLSSRELEFLAIVADYSRRAGIGVEGVERLAASKNFPAFRQKIEALSEFIDRQKCNTRERRLLIMFGFELLHEHVTRNSEIAADARTLMNWVHRMPAVFDSHFPGYGANGLLGVTVKRQLKGVNEE